MVKSETFTWSDWPKEKKENKCAEFLFFACCHTEIGVIFWGHTHTNVCAKDDL